MGNIRTIFDEESDLHDLRADPNMVIEIQKLVTEMLGANEHRRIGIRQEIVDKYGVAALPGVISATFVLTKQLSNRKNQQMLAELIRELAVDNPGAIRMLVKAGVADNPFAESRAVMVEALAGLDAALAVREMAPALLKAAERAKKVNDQHATRQIYELLMKHGLSSGETLSTCKAWFADKYHKDEAVQLLSSLLRVVPDRTEEILFDLFSELKRTSAADESIKSHLTLPTTASIESVMRASNRILVRESVTRSKPVEALFEGAVASHITANPAYIAQGFYELENSKYLEEITRYWWQALSAAARQKSMEAQQAFRDFMPMLTDELSQKWAIVQLMFISTGNKSDNSTRTWAKNVLDTMKTSSPDVFEKADITFKKIISTRRQPGGGLEENGSTGIKKSSH